MRSAGLKINGVIPRENTLGQSARRKLRAELEPGMRAPLSKSKTLPLHSLDRTVAARAQEDEDLCVTRIEGQWAFCILSQLQHGPTQLSQLGRTVPQTSRKKLTQYLCKLEKAGLIVVDRSRRMPQDEYALSDPLGIAAANLMNALAQFNRRGTGARA